MKSYLIFLGKLCLILVFPTVLGWLLVQRVWGAALGAALPIVLLSGWMFRITRIISTQ